MLFSSAALLPAGEIRDDFKEVKQDRKELKADRKEIRRSQRSAATGGTTQRRRELRKDIRGGASRQRSPLTDKRSKRIGKR
jgi:hypothetical protein